MKSKKIGILIGCLVLFLTVYLIYNNFQKDDVIVDKTISDIDTSINTDDGDLEIDWSKYFENNISKSTTITNPGIYNLQGNIEGSIIVKTTGNVKLVLDNVSIKSSDGPAILIEEAENTLIYLNEGTKNYLEDSKNYQVDDLDINSVIYSKDDLIFDGNGSLEINANYQDGIVSKDDLKIINGNFLINSVDDGIRGKDSIYILNGNFNINSKGDSLKSTNDTDSEKGFILIENGTFNFESELDGIQAETKLVIQNGNFSIKTGGGSSNSSLKDSWGSWGRHPMESIETTDSESAKGLKAGDNLVIENGTFKLDTSDDSIHSNNYFGLKNGNISILSGDDGIHADTEIIIDSGSIIIEQSYEGIESNKITINNGDIKVISTDDGINVSGGVDSSGMNRPGENHFTESNDNILVINSGSIYVNSVGDGIDVNGSAYMNGGEVLVDGPTNSGNGPLDYDQEFVIDGGTLIAVGLSGMLQSVSSNKQYNVVISLTNSYSEEIILKDTNNQEIINYTPKKTYSSVIISSPKLKKGETYKLQIGEEDIETFTIESYSTTIGSKNNSMPGNQPNQSGKGGRR